MAAAAQGEESASEGLERVDRLYAETKRSRPQRPWTLGAPVGKCNQCNRREAVGPTEEGFDGWRDWYGKLAGLESVERGVRIDAGERLCYVCLARRLAAYPGGRNRRAFASTGEVAARPWLEAVRRQVPGGAELLAELSHKNLGDLDLARALYLPEERLRVLGEENAAGLAGRLRQAIREHNRRRTAKEGGRPLPLRPPGYLALVTFDGDDMGKAVRGDLERMPRKLTDFATTVGELLESHNGEIFYLGGDEGLAMLPAAPALAAVQALRDRFNRHFGGDITLSAGLAYFEHSRPMAGAIRAAREVLKAAKAKDGKNALGVAVETASGNRWSFVEPWGTGWGRISRAVHLVRTGKLAAGWAYDVESLLATLPAEGWPRAAFRAGARAEVRRLLGRRLARGVDRPGAWAELKGESWWEDEEGKGGGGPALEPLHLIAFLARQAEYEAAGAGGDEEKRG